MLDFSLKIDCSNDSLSDRRGVVNRGELAEILLQLSHTLRGRIALSPGEEGRLYDVNGNHVGQWILQ